MENIKPTCNCDEALRESPCPIHDTEILPVYPEPPTPTVVLITAGMRVEPFKKSNWQGFAFKCPALNCGENSIMYWGKKGFNFCPNCGSKLSYEWDSNNETATPSLSESTD